MKRFLGIFAISFICVAIFFFFGGFLLFDLSRSPYLAAGAIAFIIAVVISVFAAMYDEIEELKTRISELEKRNAQVSKPENKPEQ